MITIEETGPLALIQDLGRPGLAHLGVPRSGAADRTAFGLAQRLVGNRPDAVAIEITLGGLAVLSQHLHWVAVGGAPTQLRVNDMTMPSHTLIALRAGDRLVVEPPARGLRNYLAIRGGIDSPVILGSHSTDLLSGIGPVPLMAGQRLPIGGATEEFPAAGGAFLPAQPSGLRRLSILPGPRLDWFTDQAGGLLTSSSWQVTPDIDRVGIRLSGPTLARRLDAELPSEGLVRGAVQIPASGQPLIFGPDHPVTGGYPVIAVLTEAAADQAAQLRPGDRLGFAWAQG